MSDIFKHIGEGQIASSSDYNRLTDAVTSLLHSTNVQYFTDSSGVHVRRMPAEVVIPSALNIFQITVVGTRGRYTCKKYIIDSSNWAAGSGVSRLVLVDDDEYDIFNIAENATTTTSSLAVDDILLASENKDDEGNLRWVGFTPKFAWWVV